MSDTPRTDAAEFMVDAYGDGMLTVAPVDFARQLERELTAMIAAAPAPAWTTEPPTVAGWYWFKSPARGMEPEIVAVTDLIGRELHVQFSRLIGGATRVPLRAEGFARCQWLGPIEPPATPSS